MNRILSEHDRERNRQYARDRRSGKKRMCPQCGYNELDKFKQLCSECVVANRQITVDKAQHTYFKKPEVISKLKFYRHERYLKINQRLKNEMCEV